MIKLHSYLTDMMRAVAFLSRLPVPSSFFETHDGTLKSASKAFPVAGLVITLPAACMLFVLLTCGTDPLLSSIIALTIQIGLTGALHEDGLADTVDGFGSRERERALAIMKDSRIGTYGTLALLVSFALRASALASLARHAPPETTALCLCVLAAISRAAMVWHWQHLPPAKADGIAATSGQPGETDMRIAVLSGFLLAILTLWPLVSFVAMMGVLLVIGSVTLWFTKLTRRKLLGHTGDTLGATQVICETAALCALAILG